MRWFVFQPWSVTAPDLGPIDMLHNLFNPGPPLCLICFWNFLYYLLRPTVPPISKLLLSQYLYVTPSPHLLPWHGEPSTWTSSTPNTLHLKSLVYAPCTACLCLCLLCCQLCLRSLPCCRPRTAPRSLSDPGGSPVAVPSVPLCLCLSLPMCCAASWHVLVLGLSFHRFQFYCKDDGSGHLHFLEFSRPIPRPPPIWPLWRHSGYPPPPPLLY